MTVVTTTQIQEGSPGAGSGSPLGWQDRLDHAQDGDEIVVIAREFVARISAEEYSLLPADCRPRKLVDADDVVDYAVTLVRRSCATDSMSDAVVEQLASFFTDACSRLSQLGREASDTPLASQ